MNSIWSDKVKRLLAVITMMVFICTVTLFAAACTPSKRPAPTPTTPNKTTPKGTTPKGTTPNRITPKTTMPKTTAPTPTPGATTKPSTDSTKAQAIASKVSKLKSVNSASCVISGNKAWVGCDLKASPEGKMTNAIKNEVTNTVKKEDSKIKTVYVTADADSVTRIKKFAADIAKGRPVSGFINELNEIGRRVTPSAK